MAWLKVCQELRDHRKIMAVAERLDMEPVHVMGHVISFWMWCVDNAPSGQLDGISVRSIERAAQWSGEKGAFVAALADSGLLDEQNKGEYSIHDWEDYTGALTTKRAKDAQRKREERKTAKSAAETVQEASDGCPQDVPESSAPRVEKSRVEKNKKTNKEKPVKHRHGQYDNVLLTDEDMEKLQQEFPDDWQWRIENLSEYIASTGKGYKNHLATIRNWARRNEKPPKPKEELLTFANWED